MCLYQFCYRDVKFEPDSKLEVRLAFFDADVLFEIKA